MKTTDVSEIVRLAELDILKEYPNVNTLTPFKRFRAKRFGFDVEYSLVVYDNENKAVRVTCVLIHWKGKEYFKRWGSRLDD